MNSRLPSRALVLLLALWYSLKTFGRRRLVAAPKRILVAHHLLIGDTLMLTPLLAKLRLCYPDAQVVMTVRKSMVDLYRTRPYGVVALPYDPRDVSTLIRLIEFSNFDLAVVPGDNRYSWLARALGARWIIAFAGDRPAYKNWPVDELIPYPDTPAAWGDMVAGLISGPTPTSYDPQQWPEPECAPFTLPQTPYCVLHVGVSTPLRLWESEKWRTLADGLAQQGFAIVWSTGRNEHKYVSEIDPAGRYHSYAGKLDLAQLWRLIRHAALLVCPDTGVAHLGRIVGTPTVTLFGPGSALLFGAGQFWRFSPYRAVTVDDFPCRDQRMLFKRDIAWVRHCSRSTRECPAPACMQAIEVADVERATTELLAGSGV